MSLTFNMVSGNYGDIPTPTEKTVSGAVVHITDALRKPAVALSTAINPVQDLHGYNSPWPAGGGKNLFKPIDSPIEKNGVTIEMTADGEFWVHGTPTIQSSYIAFNLYTFTFTPALDKTVTFSINEKTVGVGLILGSGNGNLNLTLSDTATSKTGTYTQGLGEVRINVRYDVGAIDKKYKIQLEISNSATTWTPYSNICPISGETEANIVVSPTQDAQDGTTYTISFGSTAYAGTLDVISGLLKKRPSYASYNGEALIGPWISSMDAYAVGTTPTTGAQVVDLGGAETTVTLTPTEVNLLLGTNNVWSDTNGDTTLTYLADGRVNSLTALNMLLGGAYTPSADVSDREALQIIMGETT